MKRQKSAFELAIEREDWDAAAVFLVYTTYQMMQIFPPEAIEELVELLADEPPSRVKKRLARRG
ncbi:MAG: hypothetical protein ABI559_05210 [Chloroflexota bacterium]